MKALFTTTLLLVMILFMLTSMESFAQSGTLVVYANGQTLDKIINGDVTGGIQNHSVYQLVSRDTTYLLDATITSKSSISLVGVPDPTTGKLPCIEADVLADQSIPGVFFTFTGQGTKVELKNLYLLGIAPNNANNTGSGQGVQVSADSISLTVDNCVFDEISQFEIGYSSNWNKFYITNSKFRNGIDVASAYYVPELLRSENYLGAWSTDSIIIKYNTMLGIAMGPVVTTGITRNFDFSHNDVVLSSKGPFWSEQVVNAKLDNNIFYNVYAVGETHTEYAGGWDEIAPPRVPAIWSFTPLDSTKAALLLGHPRNGATDSLAAEAMRTVEVKNNAYYWSSGLTSFWTSWNDTATTAYDSIYTPIFMNNETAAMFNNKTVWPGFVESGNQNVDPSFGSTIDKVLSPGTDTSYGVGLLAWVAAVRSGKGTTESYSYQKTMVGTALNWTPTWPLPESADLKYTSASVKSMSTDGLPEGDPYWFGGVTAVPKTVAQVPNQFALYEAYPNPFNPATNIKFSLSQSGNVSLKIYNVMGQLVRTLVDNVYKNKGDYNYQVNMDNLSSGVYFYTLIQGNQQLTKKMVLMK
ncbi:MAG: T9SS type A sorting domain-containing protein [Ignavibacteriaceae bacterium]